MYYRCLHMGRFVAGYLFLSVPAGLLLGCGAAAPQVPVPPKNVLMVSEQPQLPFSVAVVQELNDGARLFVKVGIEAHARWSTAESVVVLTGYRNGVVVGQQRTPLTALGPVLEQGSHHELPIVLTASQISDYQIELMWGRDSHELLAQRVTPVRPGHTENTPLEVRNLSVHSERVNCEASQRCELQFAISAELRNSSEKKIDQAVLGAGFIWVDSPALDLSRRIPENEVTVELAGLNLGPGASRKIRMVLDRTVPERPDGAFQPVVRVVSSSP